MNDGHKRKSQKHQNKTAFKIVFDPQALDKHKKVSFRLLCVRCADQMQWKLTYNKYKKMSEPTKCNYCFHKIVVRSYMRACDECCIERHTCPKCLDDTSQDNTQPIKNEKEKREESQFNQNKMAEVMKTLKERSRRTVRRGLEKGTVSWDRKENCFVDQEGLPLVGLHLRRAFVDGDSASEDHPDQEIDAGTVSAEEDHSSEQDIDEDEQKQDKDEDEQKEEIDEDEQKEKINDTKQEINQEADSGQVKQCGQEKDVGQEQDWQDEDDEEDWEDDKKEKGGCCKGPCGSRKKCCK